MCWSVVNSPISTVFALRRRGAPAQPCGRVGPLLLSRQSAGRYCEEMTADDQVEPYRMHVDKSLLITGAVLTAIGGAVAFAGMALGATAVFSAARDFLRHMEVPPREMAARRWRQAKEAAGAGAQAWRSASSDAH